jgi:hypothetical protein
MIESQAVRETYRAQWGESARKARFEVEDFAIEVLKWDAGGNREGVNIYATVGASAYPVAGRSLAHRYEFFIGLLPARDEIASGLAALGLYSAREKVELDHGHTVPTGDPPWPGSAMIAFLVVRPLSEFLPAIQLPDQVHVEFLQAIPIYASERAFKASHGAEALLERWEKAGVPFWNPDRPPNPA